MKRLVFALIFTAGSSMIAPSIAQADGWGWSLFLGGGQDDNAYSEPDHRAPVYRVVPPPRGYDDRGDYARQDDREHWRQGDDGYRVREGERRHWHRDDRGWQGGDDHHDEYRNQDEGHYDDNGD